MASPSVISRSNSQNDWWPTYVAPSGHPNHLNSLTKWLLEIVPPTLRSHPVIHRHVPVLLHLAHGHLAGSLDGARTTYSTLRASLAPLLPPETIAAALIATADCGRELQLQLTFVEHMIAQHCE